jgi:hypothetical protein
MKSLENRDMEMENIFIKVMCHTKGHMTIWIFNLVLVAYTFSLCINLIFNHG